MTTKKQQSFTMKFAKESANAVSLTRGNSDCKVTSLYLDKLWLHEVDENTAPLGPNSEFEVTIRRTR